MPMWRCPHCGTPQAETARCWVCHRSSTACGTCRHFRRSVAAQLGYCGLDRTRQPLAGIEIRACWEGWPAGEARQDQALSIRPAQGPDAPHHREFVEVGAVSESGDPQPVVHSTVKTGPPAAAPAPDFGWNLWGDPEG
jgi:hypothetical protein